MTQFQYILIALFAFALFALFLLCQSLTFYRLCKELDERDKEKRKNDILNRETK